MKKNKEWSAETAPCPFTEQDFPELWITLLDMPKWSKKPLSSIKLACEQLQRYDFEFAKQLVENSITGNYQGVVFTDTNLKYEIYKNGANTYKGTNQAGNKSTIATGGGFGRI